MLAPVPVRRHGIVVLICALAGLLLVATQVEWEWVNTSFRCVRAGVGAGAGAGTADLAASAIVAAPGPAPAPSSLGPLSSSSSISTSISRPRPLTIVTGASDNHACAMRLLLHDLVGVLTSGNLSPQAQARTINVLIVDLTVDPNITQTINALQQGQAPPRRHPPNTPTDADTDTDTRNDAGRLHESAHARSRVARPVARPPPGPLECSLRADGLLARSLFGDGCGCGSGSGSNCSVLSGSLSSDGLGTSVVFTDRFLPQRGVLEVIRFPYRSFPRFLFINESAGEYGWKAPCIWQAAQRFKGHVTWLDSGNAMRDATYINWLTEAMSDTLPVPLEPLLFWSPTSAGLMANYVHPGLHAFFKGSQSLEAAAAQSHNFWQAFMCTAGLVAFNTDHPLIGAGPGLEPEPANTRGASGSGGGFGSGSGSAWPVPAHDPVSLLWDWTSCSLTKECIAPAGSSWRDHRQDQAALTYLVKTRYAPLLYKGLGAEYACAAGHMHGININRDNGMSRTC